MHTCEVLLRTSDCCAIVTSTHIPHLVYSALEHYVKRDTYDKMLDEYKVTNPKPRVPDARHWAHFTAEEEHSHKFLFIVHDNGCTVFKVIPGNEIVFGFPLDSYSQDIYDMWKSSIPSALLDSLGIVENTDGYFRNDIMTIDPPSWKKRLERWNNRIKHTEVHTNYAQIVDEWSMLRFPNMLQRHGRNMAKSVQVSKFYSLDPISGGGADIYGTRVTLKDGSVGYGVWSSDDKMLHYDFAYMAPAQLPGIGIGALILLSGVGLAKDLGLNTINMGESNWPDGKWKTDWSGGNHILRPELVLSKDSGLYSRLKGFNIPEYPSGERSCS